MPHEGTTQTIYRTIVKDLTFHNGGNFNIGCNVNTTIVSFCLLRSIIHDYFTFHSVILRCMSGVFPIQIPTASVP